MNTPYQDVEVLRATGYWPNGEVPEWAGEQAERYKCAPADPAVIQWGLRREIARLQAEVDRLYAVYGCRRL